MAQKVFKLTSSYDQMIYNWFSKKNDKHQIKLRYGENPIQKAVLHKKSYKSIVDFKIQGKEISYNNILDIDSGLDFLNEFREPTTVIIKHNNACGVASSTTIKKSFSKAFNTDKQSAFGGVILVNKKINEELANLIIKNFFEAVVAPGFTKSAIEIFRKKTD